jgi:hypothetical protein
MLELRNSSWDFNSGVFNMSCKLFLVFDPIPQFILSKLPFFFQKRNLVVGG